MKRNGKLMRAAGYIRISTDAQDDSPKQQREAIIKLAKELGYKIIVWYQDDGITGDSLDQRPQFCALLRATERGDFECILCWDQSRFGRFACTRSARWSARCGMLESDSQRFVRDNETGTIMRIRSTRWSTRRARRNRDSTWPPTPVGQRPK